MKKEESKTLSHLSANLFFFTLSLLFTLFTFQNTSYANGCPWYKNSAPILIKGDIKEISCMDSPGNSLVYNPLKKQIISELIISSQKEVIENVELHKKENNSWAYELIQVNNENGEEKVLATIEKKKGYDEAGRPFQYSVSGWEKFGADLGHGLCVVTLQE